jgi:hypothetical protein
VFPAERLGSKLKYKVSYTTTEKDDYGINKKLQLKPHLHEQFQKRICAAHCDSKCHTSQLRKAMIKNQWVFTIWRLGYTLNYEVSYTTTEKIDDSINTDL